MIGARFDYDCYRGIHMPLVRRMLGERCSYYTIDNGLSGAEPRSTPAYVAMCHVFSNPIQAYAAGMERGGAVILADIPGFTGLTPIIQVSDVVVGYAEPGIA